MGRHNLDFDKIVKQLNIDDGPKGDHKDKLRWEMLRQFNASKESTSTGGSIILPINWASDKAF
jgi:hypothetical protein